MVGRDVRTVCFCTVHILDVGATSGSWMPDCFSAHTGAVHLVNALWYLPARCCDLDHGFSLCASAAACGDSSRESPLFTESRLLRYALLQTASKDNVSCHRLLSANLPAWLLSVQRLICRSDSWLVVNPWRTREPVNPPLMA